MDNIKVSIIIPIYRAEKYLDKCLKSVIGQTYNNLEIILVDDGSPDNCAQICDDRAKQDFRIKVIHKENGGVSSARNAGLDIVTGEYVTFIDADDWVDKDMIESMLKLAEEKNSDIAICDFYFEDAVHGTSCLKTQKRTYEEEEILENYLLDRLRPEACAKLIKTDIIKRNHLRFDSDFDYGEDMLFNYLVMKHARSLCNLGKCKYHYLQNSGNSSTTPSITDARAKSYLITKRFAEEQSDERLKEMAIWRHIRQVYALLPRILKADDQHFEEAYFEKMRDEIMHYKENILGNNMFSKKQKFATVLLQTSPALFKFLLKKM